MAGMDRAYLIDALQRLSAWMPEIPGRGERLRGAATREEFRGRGVYQSLVARRLTEARAQGVEAAIIQADRRSSEPICRRFGFREICGLTAFRWSPDTSED